MPDWITDRLPTEADADPYGQVLWTHPGFLEDWSSVRPGEPWTHTSAWQRRSPSQLQLRINLNALATTFTEAAQSPSAANSPVHAGLSAVLTALSGEARHAIALNLDRYDHRSLYEFAAALDYAHREGASALPLAAEPPSDRRDGPEPG